MHRPIQPVPGHDRRTRQHLWDMWRYLRQYGDWAELGRRRFDGWSRYGKYRAANNCAAAAATWKQYENHPILLGREACTVRSSNLSDGRR